MESNNQDDEIPKSISKPKSINLPSHILKNLTPLDSRVKLPYESRYKQLIDIKRTNLKNKNMLIDRKSLKSKLHQELLATQRDKQLMKRLEIARIKKNQILQDIKQRASASMKRFLEHNIGVLPPSTQSTQKNPLNSPKNYFTNNICFESSIAKIKNSGFLVVWKKHSLTYLKTILTSNGSLMNSFTSVFQIIGLNAYDNSNYRSLFYSYIMIHEFNESVQLGLHPGFNANHGNKKTMFFHNCIWLFLYKISIDLITEIDDVILHGIRDYTTIQSSWINYQFYFQLFKSLHNYNLKHILKQAIRIVNIQLSITPCQELYEIRERHLGEQQVLNRCYQNFEMNEKYCQFLENLNDTIDSLNLKPIYSLIHQQSDFNTFQYQDIEYHNPCISIISQGQWRKYWFSYYYRQSTKVKLRTGKISINKLNIDRYLTIEEIGNVLQLDFVKIDDDFLQTPTQHWREQIRFFFTDIPLVNQENGNEAEFLKHKDRLESAGSMQTWLLNYFDTLPPIQTIVDKTTIIAILKKSEITPVDMHTLVTKIQEFKIHIANFWINKCQLRSFQQFQNYENLMLLYRNHYYSRIRVEFYTKSPQLIFPKYYKMLRPFVKQRKVDMMKIVTNCLTDPRIGDVEYHEEAQKFFQHVYNTIIVYVNQRPYEFNEIYRTFYREIENLHVRIDRLISQNVQVLLFNQFYHHLSINQHRLFKISLQCDTFDKFVGIVSKQMGDMKHFRMYYLNAQESIREVLQSKFLIILSEPQNLKILQGNYYYCATEIQELAIETRELSQYIYKVYAPTFNWIYADLGI